MIRWHDPDCEDPVVVLVGDAEIEATPYCEACRRSPNLQQVREEQKTASQVLCPPPDEPQGRMRLWWPPSVPYTELEGIPRNIIPHDGRSGEETSATGPFPITMRTTSEASFGDLGGRAQHTAYTSGLEMGSFRLACLPAASNKDHPIHISLETYPLANCPEYEAVSYTWAGEDNDSLHNHAVYVGPYWDILLQTRNGWEMLRFVRPERGIRLIWVDTLCIDQQNAHERAVQVTQMKEIYSGCMQVIVYLGPDIAPRLAPGTYPRRQRLNELNHMQLRLSDNRDLSLNSLLQRRYFSRLWIVQEMILSKRAVIRIGDVDFWTDAATAFLGLSTPNDDDASAVGSDDAEYFLHAESGFLQKWLPTSWWSETSAPWFQHISGGDLFQQSLPQLLALTSSAQCTDPRDRLFGILGLLATKDEAILMLPDYSLPVQQVFIGLFAHLIINDGLVNILYHASGTPIQSSSYVFIPSWVPDWNSHEMWQHVFRLTWPLWMTHMNSYAVLLQSPDLTGEVNMHVDWRFVISLIKKHAMADSDPCLASIFCPTGAFEKRDMRCVGMAVDAKTGALSVNVTQFLTIPSRPILVERNFPWALFEVRCNEGSVYLYSRYQLDEIVCPDTDSLNLVEDFGVSGWPGYLILRKQSQSSTNCAIIASCTLALFAFPYSLAREKHRISDLVYKKVDSAIQWSPTVQWDDNDVIHRGPLSWTLHKVIQESQAWLNAELTDQEQQIFPTAYQRKDVLAAYQAVFDASWPGPYQRRSLDHVYRAILGNRYSHKIFENGYMTLEFTYAEWNAVKRLHDSANSLWLDSIIPSNVLRPPIYGTGPQPEIYRRKRIKRSVIWQFLESSYGMTILYLIRQAANRTGESESELLTREPVEADSRIAVPVSPCSQVLIEDFGCEATVERVNIL